MTALINFLKILGTIVILLVGVQIIYQYIVIKPERNHPAIFFITGTSGSGKSTLKDNLSLKLPLSSYAIYDFDENGVPENADAAWRQKTTDYWLAKAYENSLKNKSTIVCGVSVPSEIMNSLSKPYLPIYFGFLKIDDDVIRSRLKQRGWNGQLIQDNINWAHLLESEVQKYENNLIINSSLLSSEVIAQKFIACIEYCDARKK